MTDVLRYSAFTSVPEGGNPAGVVTDASELDDVERQAIAAEVGYSETAFLEATGPRQYDLRFFSPLTEVDFCGHATIATAVALAERDGPGAFTFETRAGTIAVETSVFDGKAQAQLRSVPTTSRPATDAEVEAALEALRWGRSDLDDGYPPHVAFAGEHHLVLAANSRGRLADLDYDFELLKSVMTELGWTTLQLFWEEAEDRFQSRNPFPVGGVVEDPATGAAAAALGGYLREIGKVTGPRDITIIQGEDMGRRSVLHVSIEPADPQIIVVGEAVRI